MDLLRALGVLCEGPASGVERALGLPAGNAASATALFALELPPYASVYTGPEGMIGGEARDRVAGFWRALGLEPPPEPDHLAALLGLCATLAESADARARHARDALVWEHLHSWLPPYLARVRELGEPPQRAWAELLSLALSELVTQCHMERLPLHLREAGPLPPPAESGGPAFLAALLAPARSGIVLARADLARAARELGLGLRVGERAFILRALLGQDARATVRWLAGEAERQAAQLAGPDRVAGHWRARARATAVLLAREARAA